MDSRPVPRPDRLATLVDEVERWRVRSQIPALAFVVSTADATTHGGVAGFADQARQVAATPDQRWQIGSISKAFAAIGCLQLARDGALRLTDPAIRHVPWADVRPEVTVHHLLTHTAGLASGPAGNTESAWNLARIGHLGRPKPPPAPYWYSNAGYELVGQIIEAVTGEPVERVLESRVLKPLGMVNSQASIVAANRFRDIIGHRPPRDDRRWNCETDQVADTWFVTCTADGSIVATPNDFACYLRLLLNGEAPGVLVSEDFDLLTQPHVKVDDKTWYGYGLDITTDSRGETIGHSGGMIGQYADMQVDRSQGIASAMMINGVGSVVKANRCAIDYLRGDGSALDRLRQLPEHQPDVEQASPPTPDQLRIVGLYRSFNPWLPTVRIAMAESQVCANNPIYATTEVLHPIDDPAGRGRPTFAVDKVDAIETMTFDVLANDQFQVLDYSGDIYARVRRTFDM